MITLSEVGGQMSEIRGQKLVFCSQYSVFCSLFSVFSFLFSACYCFWLPAIVTSALILRINVLG